MHWSCLCKLQETKRISGSAISHNQSLAQLPVSASSSYLGIKRRDMCHWRGKAEVGFLFRSVTSRPLFLRKLSNMYSTKMDKSFLRLCTVLMNQNTLWFNLIRPGFEVQNEIPPTVCAIIYPNPVPFPVSHSSGRSTSEIIITKKKEPTI